MAYYTDTTAEGTILTAKYRDLQVGDEATDDVTQAQFDDAALFAYARINSKLRRRYGGSVPFDTADPPDAIREISDMLVVAQLRATASGHSILMKGPWKDQYDRAMAWLDNLASGKEHMPEVTAQQMIASSTDGEHPVMGKIDEFDMGQDPDQLERISDERD